MQTMRSALTVLVMLSLIQLNCRADAKEDAEKTLATLNRINIALNGLIGEAADTIDAKLQQRLAQIQGIVELAIHEFDMVAKNRIDQADLHVKEDIANLNQYVQANLLQFSALVGKHLKDLNADMRQRIDQFNFGTANTIASISFLNTVPLLRTDDTGISIFKQVGPVTHLFVVGSGMKKSNEIPIAILSGNTVKPNYKSVWMGHSVFLDVPNSSMGLLEVSIPNDSIPDTVGPFDFTLRLIIREGYNFFGYPKYSEQSVPLHICGKLPQLKAVISLWASGKYYERTTQPLTSLIHGGCAGGNTHDSGNACLPDQPPTGWEFDMDSPEYGITYTGKSVEGYYDIHHYGPGNRCITCYCDGTQGNAHCNLMGLEMKLRRLRDLDVCAPKWNSEPIVLSYLRLVQLDLKEQMAASGGETGKGCDELRAQYKPEVHVAVTIKDDKGQVLEVRDLREEIETNAVNIAGTFTFHSSGIVDLMLEPKCVWAPIPTGN